jgi:hypothetical protein
MSYNCQVLPGEPILLTTFNGDFNVKEDAPKLSAQMIQIFEQASEPMYMLDDLREIKMTFSDLVAAMALATRGEKPPLQHANMRKLVIVTNNELIRFGGNALKQTQYGISNIDMYRTEEEALEAIRAEIATRQYT